MIVAQSSKCPGIRQILAAGLELFAERGFEGASVHTIAEKAGVSKANVFHHFASKEALYLAVLRSASMRWSDEIAQATATDDVFAVRLRLMINCIVRKLCTEPDEARLLLREILENGSLRGQQLNDEVFSRNFEVEMNIFRSAAQKGELRPNLDPVIAWIMTISACVFFFQSRDVLRFNSSFSFSDDIQGYCDQICDVLLRGIGVTGNYIEERV